MVKSVFLYAPKIIFDLFFDMLYFIPWWYSRGLMDVGRRAAYFLRDKERELAIIVWLRNLLKPLYDDYRWQKRLQSVIMRLGQIIFRTSILLFWTTILGAGMILYVLLPVLVIWQIIYQII